LCLQLLYESLGFNVKVDTSHRVLRRMFGPKREEMAGGWRRLHNEVKVKLKVKLSLRF
jgi:hypothetical protein